MAFLYENEVERHCEQKITGTYLAAAVELVSFHWKILPPNDKISG